MPNAIQRAQLAQFIKDPKTLRAFEELFSASNLDSELIQQIQDQISVISESLAEIIAESEAIANIADIARALAIRAGKRPPEVVFPPVRPQKIRTGWRALSLASDADLGPDDFADVDATAGAVALTEPDPVYCVGRVVGISKNDASANAVTFSGTVNGVSTYSLTAQYQYAIFMSVGSEWRLIGGN